MDIKILSSPILQKHISACSINKAFDIMLLSTDKESGRAGDQSNTKKKKPTTTNTFVFEFLSILHFNL